jgi:hypothetical protein
MVSEGQWSVYQTILSVLYDHGNVPNPAQKNQILASVADGTWKWTNLSNLIEAGDNIKITGGSDQNKIKISTEDFIQKYDDFIGTFVGTGTTKNDFTLTDLVSDLLYFARNSNQIYKSVILNSNGSKLSDLQIGDTIAGVVFNLDETEVIDEFMEIGAAPHVPQPTDNDILKFNVDDDGSIHSHYLDPDNNVIYNENGWLIDVETLSELLVKYEKVVSDYLPAKVVDIIPNPLLEKYDHLFKVFIVDKDVKFQLVETIYNIHNDHKFISSQDNSLWIWKDVTSTWHQFSAESGGGSGKPTDLISLDPRTIIGGSGYNRTIDTSQIIGLDNIIPIADDSMLPAIADDNIVYITLDEHKIWQYDGADWVQLNLGTNNIIVIDDDTELPVDADEDLLYITLDNHKIWEYDGTAWIQLNSGSTNNVIAIDDDTELPLTADSDVLYITLDEHKIWEYDGITWVQLNSANTDKFLGEFYTAEKFFEDLPDGDTDGQLAFVFQDSIPPGVGIANSIYEWDYTNTEWVFVETIIPVNDNTLFTDYEYPTLFIYKDTEFKAFHGGSDSDKFLGEFYTAEKYFEDLPDGDTDDQLAFVFQNSTGGIANSIYTWDATNTEWVFDETITPVNDTKFITDYEYPTLFIYKDTEFKAFHGGSDSDSLKYADLTNQIDGTNVNFTLPSDYEIGTPIIAFLNKAIKINNDYIINDNILTFINIIPIIGDEFWIYYSISSIVPTELTLDDMYGVQDAADDSFGG